MVTEHAWTPNTSAGTRLWSVKNRKWSEKSQSLWLDTLRRLLQWRHDGRDGVSNHQRIDCLLKHLFMRRSKKSSKLRVTGLCEGNSPVTGEFPAQRASNTENVSIWWHHHAMSKTVSVNLLTVNLFEGIWVLVVINAFTSDFEIITWWITIPRTSLLWIEQRKRAVW